LINYVKTYFPDTYQDFNETSPGMMMMELSAYVGDVLSFYIDQQFKEMFLATAEEKINVMNLAKTLGYKPKSTVPSLVEITVTQTVGVTGTAPNITPNMEDALVINKNMVLESDMGGQTFETLQVTDFSITGSYDQDTSDIGPYSPKIHTTDDSTGLPTKYILKTKVLASSGATKEKQFEISSPKKFMRLTLPDDDVIGILSVIDSNGNNYYEVDYLSQDRLSVPVPSKLNERRKVNRRFITEVSSDNKTSLIFGNGTIKSGLDNVSFIEESFDDVNELNALIQGTLPGALVPAAAFSSLGESPSNTTLTVTYRVGGGIESNVAKGTINTIMRKQIISSNSDSSGETSLVVTNDMPAAGGSDAESIDEIKHKAKMGFASQHRAVTQEDYETRSLSLPARFGSIAKVWAKRKTTDDTTLEDSALSVFDAAGHENDTTNAAGFTTADATFFGDWLSRNQSGTNTEGDDVYGANIQNFIQSLSNLSPSEIFTFKNIDLYILSYDNNKNLIESPDLLKKNLSTYLKQFKVLSDDVHISRGWVVNFGILFEVVSRSNVNKSELKIRCIQSIKDYFNINNMNFNQKLYISDIENLLYNIEGVRNVKRVVITQDADILGLDKHLFADGGIPKDSAGTQIAAGIGIDSYGYAYDFSQFTDGVILPPHPETPAIFELKNPNKNIKGVVE